MNFKEIADKIGLLKEENLLVKNRVSKLREPIGSTCRIAQIGIVGTQFGYGYNYEQALNNAIQQYFIENGFKLSWLDLDYYYEVFKGMLPPDCKASFIDWLVTHNYFSQEHIKKHKLICWLYSMDIKIINDLEGES